MNLLQNIQCIERLHTLNLQKKTCTPKELANLLGISRVSLYILFDEFNCNFSKVSFDFGKVLRENQLFLSFRDYYKELKGE